VSKQAIVGSTHTLSAPAQQAIGNTTQRFSSWSDGQAQTHTITMPSTGFSATARFAPVTPGASTLTFAPAADAYVEVGQPITNFGLDPQLRTDNDNDNPVTDTAETYLRFNVAGISGKVTSAKLRIRSTTNTADGPALRGVGNGWAETGITWQNRPSPTTGVISDVGAIATNSWAEWDVTPLVAADGTFSFNLSQTSTDGVSYNSREASNAALRPELVVQTSNDAYGRPRGATPVRLSLVPAYAQCTTGSANRVHGPPLEHPACNPPAQESTDVTVGTPDANLKGANSSGYALLGVTVGNPSTPADEAEVSVVVQLSDVRSRSGVVGDYAGELQFRPALRLTDRESTAAGAVTLQDLVLPVTVPCTPTLDPMTGSDCHVATTVDAVLPGTVDEGARAVWQLQHVEVLDGGPDGDVDTPGNSVFARAGIFIP